MKKPTRKLYIGIITLLSVLTMALSLLGAWAAFPTSEHRRVAGELSTLDQRAFTADIEESEELYSSEEYTSLINSPENTYSTNAMLAAFVITLLISAATTVGLYHYLRRRRVTHKPVSVLVWFTVATGLITYFPSMYFSGLIAGIPFVENGTHLVFSLIALPFALIFSALFTLVVAKVTDAIYIRSHGFVEE